eukprot:12793925-Alexandrium_andersonii.AAC.1
MHLYSVEATSGQAQAGGASYRSLARPVAVVGLPILLRALGQFQLEVGPALVLPLRGERLVGRAAGAALRHADV